MVSRGGHGPPEHLESVVDWGTPTPGGAGLWWHGVVGTLTPPANLPAETDASRVQSSRWHRRLACAVPRGAISASGHNRPAVPACVRDLAGVRTGKTPQGPRTSFDSRSKIPLFCSARHLFWSARHLFCSARHLSQSADHLFWSADHLSNSARHLSESAGHLSEIARQVFGNPGRGSGGVVDWGSTKVRRNRTLVARGEGGFGAAGRRSLGNHPPQKGEVSDGTNGDDSALLCPEPGATGDACGAYKVA